MTERALSLAEAAGLPRCETCKHWEPDRPTDAPVPGWPAARRDMGTCRRWSHGYDREYLALPVDGCHVEDDEGWGNMVGAQFGCVLHEPK